MSAIVTEMISILTSGISSLASGIGSGINTMVSSLFIDTTGNTQTLSVAGGIIMAFAAIALAVGLTTFCVKWLMSLGARN